jgi:hypothetical protein
LIEEIEYIKKLPNDDVIIIDKLILVDDEINNQINNQINNETIIDNSNNYIITIDENKILQTEDLGKIFEMAICLLYEIPFDGKYKYSMEDAQKIRTRIEPLLSVFPYKIKHTAKNGNQYDFCGQDDETIKLSAKTTKKDGKVCPQVIGQPSRKKFCNFFNIDISLSLEGIKSYIETNIVNMLSVYFELTFDCPIIYYNKNTDLLQLIKLKEKIDWTNYLIEFSHIKKNKQWVESSTISINNLTIGEFQLHKHRDCIKFRWSFEKLLKYFVKSFSIINL